MKRNESIKIMSDDDYEKCMKKKHGSEERFTQERVKNKINYENYLKRQEVYEKKYVNKSKKKKFFLYIFLIIITLAIMYWINPELIKKLIEFLL